MRLLDDRKRRGHRPDIGLLGGVWLVLSCNRCRQLTAARVVSVPMSGSVLSELVALSLTDRQLAAVALLTAGLGPESTRAGAVCDVLDGVRPADLRAVAGITAIYAGSMADDSGGAGAFLQFWGARLSWGREFGESP